MSSHLPGCCVPRRPADVMKAAPGYRVPQTWLSPIAKAAKPTEPEFQWLHDIADAAAPEVRRRFLEAIKRIRGTVKEAQLRAALETGNVDKVVQVLGLERDLGIIEPMLLKPLEETVREAAVAALDATPAIAAKGGALAMRFDMVNPHTVQAVRNYGFNLIRQVTDDTRDGIRAIVSDAMQFGGHPEVQARQIRSLIGLTDNQAGAVSNFRRLLENRDAAALDRALRDKRFDGTLNRVLGDEGVDNLTPEQVDRMVERYSSRMLDFRATNIARTETINAARLGTQAAWVQSTENGLLERSKVRQGWMVTPDDRLAVVGARTKVMTIGGWKSISMVQIGDSVLTHKDRFRKVLSLDKRHFKGPIVTIDIGGRAANKVTVTHEHKILVHRGGADVWVFAKDLLDDDEFYINAVPCADCGDLIPSSYRMKTEVCSRCSSLRSNKSRWSKDGEREKLIAQNDKRWAIPGSREAQREKFTALLAERGDSMIAKGLSARGKNHAGHSFLEKKMRWFLEKQQIPFEAQWFFTYERNGKRTRGYADFLIPGRKIIIECDGPFHSDPDIAAKDIDRDAALKLMGYTVLRFCDRHIRREFGVVADAIRTRCCLMRMKAKSIIRRNTNHQPCYDLQVEQDESFVAGGIVVHNCVFCAAVPALNPDGVRLGEQFITPLGPVDGPTLHPNCRCIVYLMAF